jgi:hypothetical protein
MKLWQQLIIDLCALENEVESTRVNTIFATARLAFGSKADLPRKRDRFRWCIRR